MTTEDYYPLLETIGYVCVCVCWGGRVVYKLGWINACILWSG